VPTAVRLCRSLEDAGQIDWFEKPVPVESYHALGQVREKVCAGISVTERLHTRWETATLAESARSKLFHDNAARFYRLRRNHR
jgi:galactonate dehydratase